MIATAEPDAGVARPAPAPWRAPGRAADREMLARLATARAVRVLAVADTHLRRTSARALPDGLWPLAREADAILHAGDVVDERVLDELSAVRPVLAVCGNNDAALAGVLPEHLAVVLAGVRVAMVHDSGPARGRAQRLASRFPDAGLVVFGHSHIPWDEVGPRGQVAFNPGSPTQRRRQPHHTVGVLDLVDARVARRRIAVVDPPRSTAG